jgi:outer membrane protein assembly factor BamB
MIVTLILALLPQDDWTHWRGPRAAGSVESGTFPTTWDAPAWKVKLPGKGGSTPLVVGERIYLTAPDGEQDAVLAFDLEGKQAWSAKLGAMSRAKHKTLGSSCNASPATDGRGLFVYFRSGRLAALELDGAVRWQVNVVEKWGPEQLFWDQGTSPVVTERRVVLARMHGGESWLAAFDKATGELSWKEARTIKGPVENDNGYTTPIVFKHEGRTALLVWGSDLLSAHDEATGRVIWSCGGFNPDGQGYWPAISTPVLAGDLAVVPVGRDDRAGQARVHGIRLGGAGDVTATHRAWKRDDVGVFVPSPAESGGRVYLLRHRGGVVCLDPATGRTQWAAELPKGSASYYASPVVAGGVLYAAREDGAVFTARVGESFRLLGEHKMGERIVASPVPARGRLLLRGDEHLFCITAK